MSSPRGLGYAFEYLITNKAERPAEVAFVVL
jgi:hypothetical protein